MMPDREPTWRDMIAELAKITSEKAEIARRATDPHWIGFTPREAERAQWQARCLTSLCESINELREKRRRAA